MSEFIIKPATRQAVKPLIGLYSESGCGKTYSALLLARGIVGPTGKIVMADSESGRGDLYCDVLPGSYNTLTMANPFSPARHIGMIEAVEQSGAGIGILDSGSHEWEGLGGVLDMAAQSEEKSGKSLNNWRMPKLEHAKFMLRLLQSSIPWIVCLRAKYKTRQIKENGKTVIVKDEVTTPIQADDFIFEMTAHAEILPNHSIILSKCSHPDLRKCFPADKTTPLTIEHGEMIARWCNAGTVKPANGTATGPTEKTRAWMIDQLKGREQFALAYAIDKAIIMPDQGLDSWPLAKVPKNKSEMNSLLREINVHADGDGVA
jgi:hypothetical protein